MWGRDLLLLFSCSIVSDSLQPHGLHTAHQVSLSVTISWSLLRLMSAELVMPSSHLLLVRPLLFLPSVFPSIRVFANELACILNNIQRKQVNLLPPSETLRPLFLLFGWVSGVWGVTHGMKRGWSWPWTQDRNPTSDTVKRVPWDGFHAEQSMK